MINILYIETGMGRGGSALSLKYLLDALDRTKYRPILVFTHPDADLYGFDWRDVEILRTPDGPTFMSIFTNVFRLARIINEKKIDLIHLNNDIDSQNAGIFAAKITNKPFVCHLRSMRSLTRKEKFLAKLIYHFIAISEAGRDFYIKEGLPPHKITVSYDPFDVNVTATRAIAPAMNLSGKKVGICSRLTRGKGHEYFIKAAAEVVKQEPEVHFFIVGEEAAESPGYQAELQRQVVDEGLGDHVSFLGWQKDIMAVISNLDLVVDASYLPEGLRRTIIEAMIAFKPIIATDVGPVRELIERSQSGFVIPYRDSAVMAQQIVALLKDPGRIKLMGENGRKYAVEKFDMFKKAKEIEALYDSILKNHDH
ncbi:MAG TPA: glycosyltransferase family 4 protein [Candidatus Omnitrophota bacterium]|nr:glycosyltransferase family 4 protein [Candidatus Omnitrophota bacterium]